jgi:hypothetical protein
LEYVGFGLLFGAYLFQILKAIFYDRKKAAEKLQHQKEKELKRALIIENAITEAKGSIMKARSSVMSFKRGEKPPAIDGMTDDQFVTMLK